MTNVVLVHGCGVVENLPDTKSLINLIDFVIKACNMPNHLRRTAPAVKWAHKSPPIQKAWST